MAILVTGGAGYIGSHTCVELLSAGWEPVVVDNLSNSSPESLHRVEAITGKSVPLYTADIRDAAALREIFSRHSIEAVIHFAGLKAVGESVAQPLRYYQNNVAGTLTLCEVMEEFGVNQFVFSSSATVYGDPAIVPVPEDCPTAPESPYGASKLMVENILRDVCAAPDSQWKVSLLRYFNPIGAHETGRIGEDPSGIPNNLLPYVAQVAVGRLPLLQVFGDDYDTVDGTGVRDYIHVVDLARGHLAALEKLRGAETVAGCYTYNLGTGKGSSVLEVVKAFEQASAREIPIKMAPRRDGDVAEYYANPALAEQELGWRAEYDLLRMAEDTWRWQSQNPNGYRD
ncbi:UDP-glucose 4-epimerase GalE [Microbulbifer flavimaris]|uniref:UDP-glucose 4-epimerase n=1 Tax=Microbulbifer flavimaris TaxID=1781068 RepID=A0ABX4I095_9GAMM|nr:MULTISPECIES: UDP-glucose 4-epimerase GalE [Microbulbifer]KUJ83146.1 UDP-glucose 4-epimerase [Microbulbifer sp. ZGT114]PCO05335.1 UDP-glucose 4-epimerase GalE [Microbulbifer flavimaris]